MAIRVRKLRLRGLTQDYEVDFTSDGRHRSLAIIAGEISTGKTAVLEFVDYCLGAENHPSYSEVQRQVRSALLEIEVETGVIVIERALFSPDLEAFVHDCSLLDLDSPHSKTRKPLKPAGSEDSLSSFLLDNCGLLGVSLKEAPTKQMSQTDPLSFRDIMWTCYLANSRLDSKQLLHESNYMKALKLRQVIEVIFEVHDDRLAKLSDSLASTDVERRRASSELESLLVFLKEQKLEDRSAVEIKVQEINTAISGIERDLVGLSETMRAETAFAENIRREYSKLADKSSRLAARVRDRETLLHRLLPLRGQYAEDEKKLVFFDEAKQLFDPLRVDYCPCCLQALSSPAKIEDGTCSLCGENLQGSSQETLDVRAELRNVRLHRREIDKYVGEVEEELEATRRQLVDSRAAETRAQRQLDSDVASKLSPFVAQRDSLLRKLESLKADLRDQTSRIGWHDGVEKRRARIHELEERAKHLREKLAILEAKRVTRREIVRELSSRFERILDDFGYPKLYDPEPPFLDKDFVPHVRGNIYKGVGSSGALTLISLAWMLSIFELAIEQGHSHPGFLMIDSPQKNLTPSGSQPTDSTDPFKDPAIAEKVWAHITQWSSKWGEAGQLVIVDNLPPDSVADDVVVRYSGRLGEDPYGLIENETGEEGSADEPPVSS